jgi:hypothetical protein
MEFVFHILVDVVDCLNAPATEQQEVTYLRRTESTEAAHGVEFAGLKDLESSYLVPLIELAEEVCPRLGHGDRRED